MKNSYLQPAFLICITALAVSGAGMSYTIKKFGVHLQKQPLYLLKSLDLLDQKSLAPYKVIKNSSSKMPIPSKPSAQKIISSGSLLIQPNQSTVMFVNVCYLSHIIHCRTVCHTCRKNAMPAVAFRNCIPTA